MGTVPVRQRPTPGRIRTLQVILLILVSIISYGALILPVALRPAALPLRAGEVSPVDFQAPQFIEYESPVRTEDARLAAENAVVPVYASPDPSIARNQIERLRTALQYITLVREDQNSTPEQKISDISSLSGVTLKKGTIEKILALTSARWDTIQQEALSVLEQVMRRSIRDQEVDSVQHSVPSLVSLALNEEQAAIVSELVTAFIIPNSVQPELTEAAKNPRVSGAIMEEYKPGEIIVLRGRSSHLPSLKRCIALG
jgi:membrane-associated HD superfamily phosphohydrolase